VCRTLVRNIFSHVPSTKVREIAAIKAIHAGEDIGAARQKAVQVIEKLRGLRLTRRLVDGDHLAHAAGARRPRHGALAAAADRRDPPFGSGLAIYLDRVRQTLLSGR
jgi:hypothetical protein